MQSVRFETAGDPLEVLHLVEVDEPMPGPGEVLVRLRARIISISDLYFIRGHYGLKPTPPCSPGFEGVGTVEVVGRGVSHVAPGDRVIVLEPTQRGTPGTWQECVVTKANEVFKVGDTLADSAAAQVIANPLSAWLIATRELALQPGQFVLLTAGASSFSRLFAQVARMCGAKCIHLARSRARAEEVLALGADYAISTEENFVERVLSITGGRGVDAVIDTLSGKVASEALKTLKTRGKMLVFGLLAGLDASLDFGRILFSRLEVRGFWVARWIEEASAAERASALGEVCRLLEANEMVPPVETEYELSDFKSALPHADRFGRSGKIVLFS